MEENSENNTSVTTHLRCTWANKISSEEWGFWSLSNSFYLHTFQQVQFWWWTCVLCIIQPNSAERALKFITVLYGERRRHIIFQNIKMAALSRNIQKQNMTDRTTMTMRASFIKAQCVGDPISLWHFVQCVWIGLWSVYSFGRQNWENRKGKRGCSEKESKRKRAEFCHTGT